MLENRKKRIAMALSAALITSALPFSASATTYVVKNGDNLSKIAGEFNTSVDAIAQLNGIKNVDFLSIDQVLKIPTAEIVPEEKEEALGSNQYVVVRNDNLSKIALKFNITVEQLVEWNNIKNVNFIREGSVLVVSADGKAPVITPTPEEDKAPAVEEEKAPEVSETPDVEEEKVPAVEETPAPEEEEIPEVEEVPEEEEAPEVEEEKEEASQTTQPGDVLPMATDMTNWKVQLPLFRDEYQNSVLELDADDLVAGFTTEEISEIFYVDEDGWVVMDCPVDGAKTANTSYSRNEFREMLDPNNTADNWEFTGTHILNTTTKVTKAPSNGRTVTSQIHGIEPDGTNGPVLVKVEYDYSQKAVVVLLKTGSDMTAADSRHYFYDVDLDQVYDTEIKVTGGSVYVTVESEGRSETFYRDFAGEDPNWFNFRGYFKAGNYVQDSVKDYEGEGATVLLKKMDVFHDNTYTEYVPVKQIDLVQTELTMSKDETTKLLTNFTPIDTLNKGIDWSVVSGADVAAVDKNGNVTGISYGSAVIRATSQDNSSVYVDCAVTVADVPAIENVVIFETNMSNLAETDPDYSGVDLSSKDNTSSKVVSEDGNDIVMVVDDNDNANARVEFHFEPQETTTTMSFRIRVDENKDKNPNKPQTSCIYIDFGGAEGSNLSSSTQAFRLRNLAEYNAGSIFDNRWGVSHSYSDVPRNWSASTFEIGEWKDITVILTPNNGTADANTATVYMDGMKVADRMGANVSVDQINQMNIYSGTADLISFSVDDVVVYSGAKVPEAGEAPAPSGIVVDQVPGTMAQFDSVQLHAEVTPDGSEEAISYKVQSGSALAVNATGFVTAKEEGDGVIRVYSTNHPEVYTDVAISVASSVIRVDSITPDATTVKVNNGETVTLGHKIAPINASEQGVKYSVVSGEEVITVDQEGVVTGIANGSAVIRITALDNDRVYTDLSVNVVTILEPGTVLFEDTFSGENIDTNNWDTATANVGNTENKIKDGALYLLDNNTGGQPKSWVAFEPQTDTFTIEYDLMLHRDYDAERISAANMGFGSGTITSSANEAFRLRTYASVSGGEVTNRYFRYHDVDGSSNISIDEKQETFTLELDTWVTVAMTTTPDNGSELANTTSIYINGELMVENAPNKNAMTTIDQFIFQTGSTDLTEYSIDNFKVWVGDYQAEK